MGIFLKAALLYRDKYGFSVIPVKPDKKPLSLGPNFRTEGTRARDQGVG